MKNNDGMVALLRALKSININGLNYDKGIGTFDIGTVDQRYYLSTVTIVQPLKPNEYLVNSNLLSHKGETEPHIDGIHEVTVYNRFKPGEYLVAYVNNTPVVLCELVRGDNAHG